MTGPWTRVWAALTGFFALIALAQGAHAHPEDEICGPDSGLDPALCDALRAIEQDGQGPYALPNVSGLGDMGIGEVFWAFVMEGWTHVLPDGLDHLLFVAALFISTQRIGPLLAQVSAFTVAHTAAVGITAAGIIAPTASLVEPLITASVAVVAIECIVFREPPRWRLIVVFLFGLIHGMGFARAFSLNGSGDADALAGSVFWPGLIGFNVGVEAAQIMVGVAVFGVAWAVRRFVFQSSDPASFRTWFVIPVSALIGLIGAMWTVSTLTGG
ncbi:MAG: HupE/UreJ family protein [Pseudomonadota bacterium]